MTDTSGLSRRGLLGAVAGVARNVSLARLQVSTELIGTASYAVAR